VSKKNIDQKLVKHIAELAQIPISSAESQQLAKDFSQTLAVVDQLKSADVSQVETTHQVTGLKNVTREDKVNEDWGFSQAEALANAPQTENGFFLVPQILNTEDN
jgi:aspartyl-tRNA(Asn)/glutamyl-tRNA(Gln) amidotransferase subunit C